MPKFDHHVHTSRHSPDSLIDPSELLREVRDKGLDGVVITDHDYQWKADELKDLAASAPDLVVLTGVEVSAREGHFLVYGLPSIDEAGPGITIKELVKVVRRHNAALVAAHPFRWGQEFDEILREHSRDFHGLELVSNNVTQETRRLTWAAGKRFGCTTFTGSSDGHEPRVVGCYHSEVETPVRTIQDFVHAIREGRVRPRHRKGSPAMSGPVDDLS